MFGKDNKPLVIEAIYEAIESEKKTMERFKKEIANMFDSGETVMAPLAHMTYFKLKSDSVIVQNPSSREMYQALNSVATNCHYDGEKDQCSGSIGDFTLSLSREKDSYGSYVAVSAMPSMSTIARETNQVISNKTTSSSANTNEADRLLPLPTKEIERKKTMAVESAIKAPIRDVIVNAEKFCTQCGTENVNEAKFCKRCGIPMIKKEPSQSPEQFVINDDSEEKRRERTAKELEAYKTGSYKKIDRFERDVINLDGNNKGLKIIAGVLLVLLPLIAMIYVFVIAESNFAKENEKLSENTTDSADYSSDPAAVDAAAPAY
jgi:hypothetical protein